MDREVPEPPGLRRPKASHPPAGRPEPRAAPPALPFAGAGGEGRPFAMAHSLRDACSRWLLAGEGGVEQSSTVWCWSNLLARLPKKTAQWVQCHPRRRWTWPSNSPRTRWWRATGLAKPYRPSLSLSPPLLFPPYLPAQVPCRRGSPSPDPMERRTGTGVGGRESPRQGGGVSQTELRAYSRSSGVSTPIPCPTSRH